MRWRRPVRRAKSRETDLQTGIWRILVGLAALFSGTALLLVIIADVPLPLALAGTFAGAVILTAIALRRLAPGVRPIIRRRVGAGAAAGLVAVVVYDVVKGTLGLIDPSPYNPFETLRVFGQLMLGPEVGAATAFAVGAGLHALNGTLFGVAYSVLLGRDGRLTRRSALATGIAWGIFLESFQLALYPRWLHIQLVYEFSIISGVGHLAYGLTLGMTARAISRRYGEGSRRR